MVCWSPWESLMHPPSVAGGWDAHSAPAGPVGERPDSAGTTEPLPHHIASAHSVSSRVAQLLCGSSGLPKGRP